MRVPLTVRCGIEDLQLVQDWIDSTEASNGASSHGTLDLEKLVCMLLEDVALMRRRPGSWEGANMAQLMRSHGYEP